jgi:hypothetical protein
VTLPSSGTITLQDIATELGVGLPIDLNAANVRALAGVPSGSITMPDHFWGKSSASLSITVGARTQVRVGGSASNLFRASRPLTVVANGFTVSTYTWTISSTNHIAYLTSYNTGPSVNVQIIYDAFEDEFYDDSGTVYLTVVDTGGVSRSTSVNFSL